MYNENYSEQHTIQLLERMGVDREAAQEIFKRCPAEPSIPAGRDGKFVRLDTVQRVLEEDRNTQALNIHVMVAAMRVEDIEVDPPSYLHEIER
jgi:hypothetical protein